MVEVKGNYECARGHKGVMAALPRPSQTEEDRITEAHIEAEKNQYICNQGANWSCPLDCQIRKLIEETIARAKPHRHLQG